MFKLGYRKFILALFFSYCLFGQYTDALRCYQCKQGLYKFCSSSDVVQVTCPLQISQPSGAAAASVTTCGYAVVSTQFAATLTDVGTNYYTTWRGCSIGTSASTVSAAFMASIIFNTGTPLPDVAVYTACTSASDLCNKPRQCYRCSAGWTELCSITDIVLDECYDLGQTYCASLQVTSSSYSCTDSKCYWKGCLSSTGVSALTATNGLTKAILEAQVASTITNAAGIAKTGTLASTISAISSTTLNYCQVDGCNAGVKTSGMFSYTLVALLLLFGYKLNY